MRLRFRKRKPRRPSDPKIGSLAFFLAIPSTFLVSAFCLLTIYGLLQSYQPDTETWIFFSCGLLGGVGLFVTFSLRWIRTFIHETKHAIVVLLSGNIVTDMSVQKHTGYVNYVLYKSRASFAPLIAMAPYCFPLFTLPMLILCLIVDQYQQPIFALILGLMLAFDLNTAYREIHPHQSDLRRMRGGLISSGMFILGTNLMWVSLCLLWVAGGRAAYIHAGILVYNLALIVAEHIEVYLP